MPNLGGGGQAITYLNVVGYRPLNRSVILLLLLLLLLMMMMMMCMMVI